MAETGSTEPLASTLETTASRADAASIAAVDAAHRLLEAGRLGVLPDLADTVRQLPSDHLTWLSMAARQLTTATETEIMRRTVLNEDGCSAAPIMPLARAQSSG